MFLSRTASAHTYLTCGSPEKNHIIYKNFTKQSPEEVGHSVTTHDNEVKVAGPINLHAEVKWRLVYICMARYIFIIGILKRLLIPDDVYSYRRARVAAQSY